MDRSYVRSAASGASRLGFAHCDSGRARRENALSAWIETLKRARSAVDVVVVRESGKNYSMSLRIGATLVGMALVWTGLAIALGPVVVVAVTVLLAAIVIGAAVSIRRDRARTTPSSAKAHADARSGVSAHALVHRSVRPLGPRFHRWLRL
jgi:hypothetical protein